MQTIASNVAWGSAPMNYFTFAYERERVQSAMRYRLQISCAPCYGASYYGYPIYLEISLDGKVLDTHTLKAASPSRWESALVYTTDWLTVAGKVAGTTALKLRIYSGSGSSRSTVYQYSLAVDATASTVSATDAAIGSVCSIIISRASSSLRHTLSYQFAGQSGYTTITQKTDQSVVAWTVPASAYALIPDMPSIVCAIKCDTYAGDSLIGSSSTTMIAAASESACAPTVTATAADTNPKTLAVTGDSQIIVKGYSDLTVTVSAAARNSAKLTGVTAVCGSKSAAVSGGKCTLSGVDSGTVTVIAVDSRGYEGKCTLSGLSFVNYTPCWAAAEVTRPNPTEDRIVLTAQGGYFAGHIGKTVNSVSMRMRTQAKGSAWSGWVDIPLTVENGTVRAESSFDGYDYNSEYAAEIKLSDALTTVKKAVRIMRGLPLFDWGEDGFNFNVPITGSFVLSNGERSSYPVIEGGLVVRSGNTMLLGGLTVNAVDENDIYLYSTKPMRISVPDIYLKNEKFSVEDIIKKLKE